MSNSFWIFMNRTQMLGPCPTIAKYRQLGFPISSKSPDLTKFGHFYTFPPVLILSLEVVVEPVVVVVGEPAAGTCRA